MHGFCDICGTYVPEHIQYMEDKNCRPLDVCGLCLSNFKTDGLIDDDNYLKFSKEEYGMGIYEVKYRADNMFEAVIKVKAANAKDAKRLAWQSLEVTRLQNYGRVKFSSVRLVEGAA